MIKIKNVFTASNDNDNIIKVAFIKFNKFIKTQNIHFAIAKLQIFLNCEIQDL